MPKVSRTPEGQVQVEMPSGKHPKSHFETHRVEIEPSDNGGFHVRHHRQLKKKYDGMNHMSGGYQEPESHVFTNSDDMHKHLQTIFKGGSKAVQAELSEGEGASEGA